MQANSREVTSNQQHLHPRLAEVVQRHLESPHQAPIPAHSRQAYDVLVERLQCSDVPLVLDSFCGTGHSTRALAEKHPDHLVVGIDRSAHRLARHPDEPGDNYLLLRARCEDIWTLLAAASVRVSHHYLLYPNPWPKSAQLGRRVHGHPAFAAVLQLGGCVELRSNWQVYVEEFGVAMHLAGQRGVVGKVPEADPPMTLFERKYRSSGHDLWSYRSCIMP